MRIRTTALTAAALGIGLSVVGGAAMALAGELTGSNYHAACAGDGMIYTSCVRPGGGQTVVLTGTGLTGCSQIIQMGGGWSGNVDLSVNGDGTEMSFVVPNDPNFYGWTAITGCSLDNTNTFLFQSGSYPRLDPTITVTADDESLTAGDTPALTYTATNASANWATEPVCHAYLADDLSTYVSGALAAGEYVSRCADGEPNADADVEYVDGEIFVAAASGDGGGSDGGASESSAGNLASTGLSSSLLGVLIASGVSMLAIGEVIRRRAR